MPFDPAKYGMFRKSRDRSTRAPMVTRPQSVPGVADTFAEGMLTNDPTSGLSAMAGREAPKVIGGIIGGVAGAAAAGAPTFGVGAPMGAGTGSVIGAGTGESVRQAMVAGAGNNPDLLDVPMAMGEQLIGNQLARPIAAAGRVVGDVVGRGIGKVGNISEYAMKRLRAQPLGLQQRAGQVTTKLADFMGVGRPQVATNWASAPKGVLPSAGEAAETIPPAAAKLRGLVTDFEQAAGRKYGEVEKALVKKFGNRQIINPRALRAEMNEVLAKSSFSSKAGSDASAVREVKRLIADATKPFSGNVKGAIDMSERFNRAMDFNPTKPIAHRSNASYQKLIGDLKGVFQKHLDRRAPEFGKARTTLAEAKQVVGDARTFLNSKNLATATKNAEQTGNLDIEVITKLQQKIPGTLNAFDELQNALAGVPFNKPANYAMGAAYGPLAHGIDAAGRPITSGIFSGATGQMNEAYGPWRRGQR